METNQYYIRLSLKYGLCGALAFPFIYESYANIMRSFAIVLTAVGCLFAAIKFSRFRLSDALCASVFFMILSGGMGAFIELMIHDKVVSFLEKRSKYFHLAYKDIAVFAACILMCYMLMLLVCFARHGISLAIKRVNNNSDAAAGFIDNAFGDEDE